MKTMNRQIKFRVWNGSEMIYDVVVGRFGIFNALRDGETLTQIESSLIDKLINQKVK